MWNSQHRNEVSVLCVCFGTEEGAKAEVNIAAIKGRWRGSIRPGDSDHWPVTGGRQHGRK